MPRQVTHNDAEDFLKNHAYPGIKAEEGDSETEQKDRFLLFMADFDDAYDLIDGTGDGGIDVFFERSDETSQTFEIYQLSGPLVSGIKQGSVKDPPARKLQQDMGKFLDIVGGEQARLSDAAVSCFSKIDHAIRTGGDVRLSIRIRTLYRVSDAAREELESDLDGLVAKMGIPELEVSVDVIDVFDMAAASLGLTTGLSKAGGVLTVDLEPGTDFSRHKDSYICFVAPTSLIQYYDANKNALLHLNLRGFQGNRTPVNKDIADSLHSAYAARQFHELNNGIVLLGKTVRVKERSLEGGKKQRFFTIEEPQVVNGGQTLHTLWTAWIGRMRKGRASYVEDVLVPLKIIQIPGGKTKKDDPASFADQVARSSNTQNSISPRTLQSHHRSNRLLRRSLAELSSPWLLEIADKDWTALGEARASYLQSILGHKNLDTAFERPGKRKGYRRLDNSKLFEYTLAAYGCFADAKKSGIWRSSGAFSDIAANVISGAGWRIQASAREPQDTFSKFKQLHGQDYVLAPHPQAETFLLIYLLALALFDLTYTEVDAKALPLKAWNRLHDTSCSGDEWLELARPEKNQRAAVYEWCEHVANSMKKALLFQAVRLLARRYRKLDDAQATKLLSLPQLSRLYEGELPADVLDADAAREAKIGDPETPLYSLFQIFREACGQLFLGDSQRIMQMTSRQRDLMDAQVVEKLSGIVDNLVANFDMHKGTVPGVDTIKDVNSLEDILPKV